MIDSWTMKTYEYFLSKSIMGINLEPELQEHITKTIIPTSFKHNFMKILAETILYIFVSLCFVAMTLYYVTLNEISMLTAFIVFVFLILILGIGVKIFKFFDDIDQLKKIQAGDYYCYVGKVDDLIFMMSQDNNGNILYEYNVIIDSYPTKPYNKKCFHELSYDDSVLVILNKKFHYCIPDRKETSD